MSFQCRAEGEMDQKRKLKKGWGGRVKRRKKNVIFFMFCSSFMRGSNMESHNDSLLSRLFGATVFVFF